MTMQAHFVTFLSPGTFVAEDTTKPIDSWNTDVAVKMATEIVERYGARPYGFRFTTRGRKDDELDSKVIDTSPMYYINCRVETVDDVRRRADPNERILLSNMEDNGWGRIVTTKSGWKWTQPLKPDDIVLDVDLPDPKPSQQ